MSRKKGSIFLQKYQDLRTTDHANKCKRTICRPLARKLIFGQILMKKIGSTNIVTDLQCHSL